MSRFQRISLNQAILTRIDILIVFTKILVIKGCTFAVAPGGEASAGRPGGQAQGIAPTRKHYLINQGQESKKVAPKYNIRRGKFVIPRLVLSVKPFHSSFSE